MGEWKGAVTTVAAPLLVGGKLTVDADNCIMCSLCARYCKTLVWRDGSCYAYHVSDNGYRFCKVA